MTTNPGPQISNNQIAGLLALSAVSGAYSAYEGGKLQRVLSNHNAAMARIDAEYAREEAKNLEVKFRQKGKRIKGAVKVAISNSGFASDTGTNLDLDRDVTEGIEQDAAVIRARGIVGAGQSEQEALGERLSGALAFREGKVGAAQSVLSGVTNVSLAYRSR